MFVSATFPLSPAGLLGQKVLEAANDCAGEPVSGVSAGRGGWQGVGPAKAPHSFIPLLFVNRNSRDVAKALACPLCFLNPRI